MAIDPITATGGLSRYLGVTTGYGSLNVRGHRIARGAGLWVGASAMSETMLVANDGEASYRIKSALLMAPGLGLAQDMLIDQHFAERGRMSRLIGAAPLMEPLPKPPWR